MTLALTCLAVAFGASTQFVTGIGFSLVCAPMLIGLLGPSEGVRMAILLSALVNLAVLAGQWPHARWRVVGLFLVTAVPVTPIVAVAVRHARPDALQVAAGAAVLVGVALLATGRRFRAVGGRGGALAAGAVSAAMNTVAGTGGPAVALWMANADWQVRETRATLQPYFFTLNVVGLASLGVHGITLREVAPAALALAAGSLVGAQLAPRIPERVAKVATLAIAAVGGAAAIIAAVTP